MNAKKVLSRSLYKLLQEKPIEKISVEMILEESELSKATFYRHFSDKYELMNHFYKNRINDIKDTAVNRGWWETSLETISFVGQNKKYFRSAMVGRGQNSFYDFLFRDTVALTSEIYKANKRVAALTETERFAIEMYCVGCIYLVEKWLADELTLSAEQLTDFFYSNMPEILRPVLA